MKQHLMRSEKFGLMGFDIRTREQKVEDERQKEDISWNFIKLGVRYDRAKFMRDLGQNDPAVAKRYSISDVGPQRSVRSSRFRARSRLLAKKAAGKPIPKRLRFRFIT